MGARVRQLREEQGLTLEKLAYESEVGSKGFLSDIESGLARPTLRTIQALADHLGVALLDLVTFPDLDDRQKLVDRSRRATPAMIGKWLAEAPPPGDVPVRRRARR